VRDWCYVDDNCAALDLALRKGTPGEIYNIGAGNEIPNRQLTDMVLSLCGAGEEMVEYVTDRPGHDRRYSLDVSKMRALGWSPRRRLEESLAETVDWYRNNRWWWEPLKRAPVQARGV
jgi:dTDP-glucose 4,6-dehydratase